MSEGWAIGDLALCVDDTPDRECPLSVLPIKRGAVYRVAMVDGSPDCFGEMGLLFEGVAAGAFVSSASYDWRPAYRASRFRKIKPDEQEACEPEFVTLLKRSKVPAQPIEARRAATVKQGAVHESGVGVADALNTLRDNQARRWAHLIQFADHIRSEREGEK